MDNKAFYALLYQTIGDATPNLQDCGALCGAACCQGGDEDGMYLFPGEEALFPGADWYTLLEGGLSVAGKPTQLLVCKGVCPRAMRPLYCRLFPIMPYISRENRLMLRLYPAGICPLAQTGGLKNIDAQFRANVKAVAKLLYANERTKAFLWEHSRLMDDMALLPYLLLKK